MSAPDLFDWNAPPASPGAPASAFEAPPATMPPPEPENAPYAPPKPVAGLRDYQAEVLAEIWAQRQAGARRILLVAPTGSGKTIIAAAMVRQALDRGLRVLFLVHRRELVKQSAAKLWDVGIDAGVIQAGFPMRLEEPVQIASIQTLHARAMRTSAITLPKADVVVVDEAHHGVAKTWAAIIAEYPAAFVVGLTATPCRGDGRGLGQMFETMVECPDVEALIKLGYLVGTKVYAPATPDLKGVKTVAGDYNEKQLAERVDKAELVGDIVVHWLKLADRRKTVVFAVDVAHSVHIRDEFRRASVLAEHIDGTTPMEERDRIFGDLASGKIEVLCNCLVATEGWDSPSVSCIVLARPTKHIGLYRQMIGRVLRPWEGKGHALVLDHAGCTFQHGFVDEPVRWTLSETARAELPNQTARQKRKKPSLTTCPECKAVRLQGRPCTECGWRPMNRAGAVDVAEGDLTALERNGDRGQIPLEEKLRFYGQLLWICNEKGYRHGWAAHKYKEKFRVWPPRNMAEPIEPDQEVRSWVRSRAIAWAKSRQRERAPA